MTRDQLDDLLDASAPVARTIASGDVRAMVLDARVQQPRLKRGRKRTAIFAAAGITVGMLVGGGVAVASGFVTWPERYEDPENVVAFDLQSGLHCESRFVIADSMTGEPITTDETAEVRRWLETTDLQQEMDLDAARVLDAQRTAESPDQTVIIGPEGWLMDVPRPPVTRSADDVEATLIDYALDELVYRKLVEADAPLDEWTILGGVKCATQ